MRMTGLLVILGLTASLEGGTVRIVAPAAGEDAGPRLREAIWQATSDGGPSRIELEAGRYVIATAADANWHVVIGGAVDLTLAGRRDETHIVFRDPARGGFFVTDGDRVGIENITIDYDPLPFTQGVILAVDTQAGTIDFQVDDGFPSPNEPWFTIEPPYRPFGMAFDPIARRLKSGVSDFFFVDQVRRAADAWTLRLDETEAPKAATLAAGDRFVLLARHGHGAFRFDNVRHGLMNQVTVHASPSLTVAMIDCHAMTVRGLRVTMPEGGRRLIASNGDGIHCQNNRTGPRIEDCLFEGLSDDGINIYATPIIVRQVINPSQVIVSGAPVRVGDRLQILDPRAGVIRGEPTVMAVDDLRVTFDTPVPGLVSEEDHHSADTIYNLSACGSGFVIRNNHLRNHRRNGLLLRGGDGVIEGNTFEHPAGFAIHACNEPEWPEGPAPWGLLVRGNTFIGGAYAGGYGNSPMTASIVMRGTGIGRAAEGRILRDLRIEKNRFIDPPSNRSLSIGSARGVVTDESADRVVTFNVEDLRFESPAP